MKKFLLILTLLFISGFCSENLTAAPSQIGTPRLELGGCEFLLYCDPGGSICYSGNTSSGSIITVPGYGEFEVCSPVSEDDPNTEDLNETVLEIRSM
jgi:hypothetical protein